MEKDKRPKVPVKIYRFFMHYETIVDWFYVEPESKESKIFRPGWNAFRLPNFNHPLQKLRSRRLFKQIQEILKRKEVNWEELKKFYFKI